MSIKLDQKSKRALKLGVVGLILIMLAMFLLNWIQSWRMLRVSIAESKKQLQIFESADKKMAVLSAKVPVVEIPQKDSQKQLFTFRDSLNSTLRATNIQIKPWKVSYLAKSPRPEYQYIFLQCSGQASFDNLLNLLVDLKRNPYLVGIEELIITKPAATTVPQAGRGTAQTTEQNPQVAASGFGMAGPMGMTSMPSQPVTAGQQGAQARNNNVNIELKVSTFVKR